MATRACFRSSNWAALGALCALAIALAETRAGAAQESTAAEKSCELPAEFVENAGQWQDPALRFAHRGSRHQLRFHDDGFAVLLAAPPQIQRAVEEHDVSISGAVLEFSWPTGRPSTPHGEAASSRRSHFFRGCDPELWRSNVRSFARIRYPEVFAGVDLVVHGQRGALEYDFAVTPGADPTVVELRLTGSKLIELGVDEGGGLVAACGEGLPPFVQQRPFAYQEIGGQQCVVECSYELRGEGRFGFHVGDYDPGHPLVIDPILLFGTFLGGSGLEETHDCKVDAQGAVYVCGMTLSPDFPTTPGAYQEDLVLGKDGFVAKMAADGSDVEWATYLGGDEGKGSFERAEAIAVDANGEVTIVGAHAANNFPTTPGAYQEYPPAGGFVSRLSADGSQLLFSTLVHGAEALDLRVDDDGDCFVTGVAGASFETTGNGYDTDYNGGTGDAFALHLDRSGTFAQYATYLGGADTDVAFGCDLRADGTFLVGGFTTSHNFPTTPGVLDDVRDGLYDGFVTAVSPDGSALVASTLLGGSESEVVFGVAQGDGGEIVLAGWTSSPDHPITPHAVQSLYGGGLADCFVTSLTSDLSALEFSTFLGGSESDSASDLARDGSGQWAVVGETWSADFPTTDDAWDDGLQGERDAIVFVLDRTGTQLHYSTLLGGSSVDRGLAVSVSSAGDLQVVGNTESDDFPVTAGGFQTQYQGQRDAFVVRISGVVEQPDLGFGGPGESHLSVYGDPLSSGNDATLELTRAPATTRCFVIAGLQANPTPFADGYWVPMPPELILRMRTDADGRLRISGIPGGGGPFDAFVQCIVVDPAQSSGLGFSNAVQIEFLR